MSLLLTALVVLILLGAAWYLVEQFVPMPPPMRVVIRVVFVIVIVIYLLRLVAWLL